MPPADGRAAPQSADADADAVAVAVEAVSLKDILSDAERRPPFEDSYSLGRKLQGGSYGTVFVGTRVATGGEYAVKVVNRRKLSKHDDDAQLQEVEILRSLGPEERVDQDEGDGDPFGGGGVADNGIINIVDFCATKFNYHIVMELARGGDVFDRLAKLKVYTENHARQLAQNMMESIEFLHSRGIAHRDIKPENLLLMDTDSNTRLKLADFGFARRFDRNDPDGSMKTKCGTPAFVPPELVLGKRYGPGCDVWSAGCTLFMLLSGRAPFNARKAGKNAMFRAIRAGDFVFYDDYWGDISMSAKNLVLGMLNVDPKKRMTARQALESEWMLATPDALKRKSLNKSLTEIHSFNARRKLRSAIGAVMYAVGGKFWNIETTAFTRENLHASDGAVDGEGGGSEEEGEGAEPAVAPTFDNLYKLENKLQEGVHAMVWEGSSTETGKTYAIKVVGRKQLSQAEDAAVMNEVSILKSLRHKHIVPLLDFFETPDNYYMVMKKCSGGDVLDRVASIEQYSEKDACQFAKGLLEAVQFMHERGIAHRDLKPQNLLLDSDDDNTSVKVCDFGYAKRVHMPKSLTTLCGSLHYVAPELLKNHPYDQSADMWSVGVIIFFLLAGYLPFHHRDQNELFKIIRLGKFGFEPKYWNDVSSDAMSLIRRLLEVDPSVRYTPKEALESGWIKSIEAEAEALAERQLGNSSSCILQHSLKLKTVAKSLQWLNKDKHLSSLTVDAVAEIDDET